MECRRELIDCVKKVKMLVKNLQWESFATGGGAVIKNFSDASLRLKAILERNKLLLTGAKLINTGFWGELRGRKGFPLIPKNESLYKYLIVRTRLLNIFGVYLDNLKKLQEAGLEFFNGNYSEGDKKLQARKVADFARQVSTIAHSNGLRTGFDKLLIWGYSSKREGQPDLDVMNAEIKLTLDKAKAAMVTSINEFMTDLTKIQFPVE